MKEWGKKLPLWAFAAALLALAALMLLEPSAQGSSTQEERRIAEALSAMAGAGEVKVVLYYAQQDSFSAPAVPTGALVVAQGADDMGVRLNLIRAMRTLLGLPEKAVDVFAMEGEI